MIPSGPGNLLLYNLLFFPVTSNNSSILQCPVKRGSEVQTSLSLDGHRCQTSPVFSCYDFPFSEHSFTPGSSKALWGIK